MADFTGTDNTMKNVYAMALQMGLMNQFGGKGKKTPQGMLQPESEPSLMGEEAIRNAIADEIRKSVMGRMNPIAQPTQWGGY